MKNLILFNYVGDYPRGGMADAFGFADGNLSIKSEIRKHFNKQDFFGDTIQLYAFSKEDYIEIDITKGLKKMKESLSGEKKLTMITKDIREQYPENFERGLSEIIDAVIVAYELWF